MTKLTDQYYFISQQSQETNDGKMLQLSITDSEILSLFATWYQKVEKYTEITKLLEQEKAIAILLKYCEDNHIDHKMFERQDFKLVSK